MSNIVSKNPTNLSDVIVELPAATSDEIVAAAKRAKTAQKHGQQCPHQLVVE